MKEINMQPNSNVSGCVMFIMTGAKKRRTIAARKVRIVQGAQGIVPKLVAVK